MIKTITIQNFRGIKELKDFPLSNLSLLIGENGTSKTSILEAINFCLSPYFTPGKIKHTDFYNGEDSEIKIILELDENFKVFLPDGYQERIIECNKIVLEIKKRSRATPNKAFSDIVVVSHYVLPSRERDNEDGWVIQRRTGTEFKFDERHLSFPLKTEGIPRSFYFPKSRERQLQKGFSSSISSVFDDFNWRFSKGIEEDREEFLIQKSILEEIILGEIDEKSQEKTFISLNKKLVEIGLPDIKLSFIDSKAPFDSAFLTQELENLDLSVSKLGSGVEMAVSLLFLETLAEISKEEILILIDEPELHLHPSLQKSLIEHILPMSDKYQFVFSTHSPLFVKQVLSDENRQVQTNSLKKEQEEVKVLELSERVLPFVSSNEINFIAFGLATEEYHNELYNELENDFWNDPNNDFKILKSNGNYNHNDSRQVVFDNEFFGRTNGELIDSNFKSIPNKVTKHTYIRNKIHHSRENGGPPSLQDLEDSILKLRSFF